MKTTFKHASNLLLFAAVACVFAAVTCCAISVKFPNPIPALFAALELLAFVFFFLFWQLNKKIDKEAKQYERIN